METFRETLAYVAPVLSLAKEFWPASIVLVTALPYAAVKLASPPLRALWLAGSSRLTTARVQSARLKDVDALRALLPKLGGPEGAFAVLSGPKGVGKTTVATTALQRTYGVVALHVPAGMSSVEIETAVLQLIAHARLSTTQFNMHLYAQRVLRLYNLVARHPPIVLLHVKERTLDEKYARVAPAARTLTDSFGLRVVIDASANSLDPMATSTIRETLMVLDLMPKDVAKTEFAPVFGLLAKYDLVDPVWAVVGGSPAHLNKLKEILAPVPDTQAEVEAATLGYLRKLLFKANTARKDMLDSHPTMCKVLAAIQADGYFVADLTLEMGIKRPNPDKVTRTVLRVFADIPVEVLEPIDGATSMVIRHSANVGTTLSDLRSWSRGLDEKVPSLPA